MPTPKDHKYYKFLVSDKPQSEQFEQPKFEDQGTDAPKVKTYPNGFGFPEGDERDYFVFSKDGKVLKVIAVGSEFGEPFMEADGYIQNDGTETLLRGIWNHSIHLWKDTVASRIVTQEDLPVDSSYLESMLLD